MSLAHIKANHSIKEPYSLHVLCMVFNLSPYIAGKVRDIIEYDFMTSIVANINV